MWRNIFLFLLTVGNIQHRSTSIPVDCATRVQKCPVEKHQWAKKTREFECAVGDGYVCMRDADGYLYEGCMINFTIQANSGNCPIIYACRRNKPYLGPDTEYYRCPEEVPGCPPKHHAEYDIHQLFKYPKCLESSFYSIIENTSPRSTSMSMTTISITHVSGQESKHIAIVIVVSALLLATIGCFIGFVVYSRKTNHEYSEVTYEENKDTVEEYSEVTCGEDRGTLEDVVYSREKIQEYSAVTCGENRGTLEDVVYSREKILEYSAVTCGENRGTLEEYSEVTCGENRGTLEDVLYSRKKIHEYSEVTCGENRGTLDEDYGDLRRWTRSINESEADRIRILPLKEDDTIEVDKIYVPLSIVDEFEIHTSKKTDEESISELTPDKMFYMTHGKPASFIFMLGDAGFGKTVQCRRIAKSWCKAWKVENKQHHIDVKVIDSENTENGNLREWEESLKDFEFLFYVPMRDVNNEQVSVKDMIYDYYRSFDILREHLEHLDDIPNVLKDKRYKCLIILDGLDEWNISECKRKDLLNKGIPNCEDMYSCTFLITMRSWRFMEIESKCRQGLFDKIIRLHGLGNKGFEKLTTNILCNYFNLERNSKEFLEQCTNVSKKASSLPDLESLRKIPLLAVFFILTWHEKIETGHSLTTFYLSMIEALMKRSKIQLERNATSELSVSSIFKEFPCVSSRIPEISRLGKMAFEDLDLQSTTFVLKDMHLKDPDVKETVHLFLRIGLLIKHDASGQIHEDNARFSFLHQTIQEFIYTLHFVYDREEFDIVTSIIKMVSDIEKTLELSTVLTFLSGLSPVVGCKVSSRIAELASKDAQISLYRSYFASETYYKVFQLFSLQLSCYREVRGGKSIEDFQKNEMKFILSDIFLHGNDTDRLTIRETADILRYHANDIISLYMKLIPDDNKEGITNVEIENFLRISESLLALNIDGYDKGNCRLLDNFSPISPRLRTLGLHNVAFAGNTLTDFLTKDKSKRRIKALGLFYIKSAEDLAVDYQYQFLSVYRFSSAMSGYVQKRKRRSESEKSTYLPKEKRKPLLSVVLNVLPEYYGLSTLHVTYMDSDEDRQLLLQVVPKIKTLEHFGYHGSSIYDTPDDVYDTDVIKVVLNINRLQRILLAQISLQKDIMNLATMSRLGEIRLQQFEMMQSNWMIFAKSALSIEALSKVVLLDTNIDGEAFEMLQKSSLTIVKDDWPECED